MILLALPDLQANLSALSQLREIAHPAQIVAVVRYPDKEKRLRDEGISAVYNMYTESGAGFAEHIFHNVNPDND